MEEEHLGETAGEGYFLGAHPEVTEQFGHCSSGQDEICRSQHREEEKHGFVEAALNCNEVEEDAVAHNSHNIDDTKGNPYPDVELLQARYSNKDKGTWVVTAQIIHSLFSLGSAGF